MQSDRAEVQRALFARLDFGFRAPVLRFRAPQWTWRKSRSDPDDLVTEALWKI